MPIKRYSHLTIILILLLLATACSRDNPEDILENYVDRVGNVLEIEMEHSPQPQLLPLFPKRRDRLLTTTEIREGLIDVLRLKQCDLLPLIAERNSSLGKVYLPSQKMRYEIRFFVAVRDCLKRLEQETNSDYELLEQVRQIYRIKQANLGTELWNGIFTSKEIEDNFSRGEPAIALTTDGSIDASQKALLALLRIIETPQTPDWQVPEHLGELEQHYQTLHRNRSGGRILQALNLLTAYLNYTSDMFEKFQQQKKLCPMGKATAKAEILRNVFYKYYIGEVQPYLSRVHKAGKQWSDLNNQLLHNLRSQGVEIPKSMETYQRLVLSQTAENSLWQNYLKARDRHTQSWQKVLKQCGMMPR